MNVHINKLTKRVNKPGVYNSDGRVSVIIRIFFWQINQDFCQINFITKKSSILKVPLQIGKSKDTYRQIRQY